MQRYGDRSHSWAVQKFHPSCVHNCASLIVGLFCVRRHARYHGANCETGLFYCQLHGMEEPFEPTLCWSILACSHVTFGLFHISFCYGAKVIGQVIFRQRLLRIPRMRFQRKATISCALTRNPVRNNTTRSKSRRRVRPNIIKHLNPLETKRFLIGLGSR